jgi:hypothetical protein
MFKKRENPYTPNPPSVFICSGCGRTIYEGEDYYDLMGEQFCQDCINKARRVAKYVPDETN